MNHMLAAKKHYLQIALNSSLEEAREIIFALPASDRIIIEAGTPLIKRYGTEAISELKRVWGYKVGYENAYVVADLKCMDRGEREVQIAARSGANSAVVLGSAPIETQNAFIAACQEYNVDAMIDMMNVDKPYQIVRKLKKLPRVVILHRGVDEEEGGKMLPIYMINKIKGSFPVLVSIAGGDTPREIQSAAFNGADIVVVWKNFYNATGDTASLAEEFLRTIK